LAGVDTSGTAEPIYQNSVITTKRRPDQGQSDSAIAVAGGASGFTVTINKIRRGLHEAGTAFAAVQPALDSTRSIKRWHLDGAQRNGPRQERGNNTLHSRGAAPSTSAPSAVEWVAQSMTITPEPQPLLFRRNLHLIP